MFHKAHILPAVLLFFTLLLVSAGAFSVSAAQDPLDPYWDHDASWLPDPMSRITAPEGDEALLKDKALEDGSYYINCITSPYVFFAAPEVEASAIPSAAPEGAYAAIYPGDPGETPIPNLQLEILGESLLPWEIRFDEEGYAWFISPKNDMVLALAGDVTNGVNILPLKRAAAGSASPILSEADAAKDRQRWIIDRQADGTCLIRCAADSHFVMTVDDRFGTQYANIMLWEETGGETQRFCITDETPRIEPALDPGTYYIRTGTSEWMLLSIGDGIYDDERNIYLWESDQGDGQMFSVEYDEWGFAYIHHNDSTKVLTVRDNTARNGQSIGQCEKDGELWQRWIIEPREDGGYNIRTALNVGEVMDLTDSLTRNGISILLHWHNESQAQQWFFHSEPVPSPPYEAIMDTYAQTYGSDTGYLIMVDSSSNHLGVYQGYYGNWSKLHYWDCVTGKGSTPTPLGEFVIFGHTYSFDGNEDSPVWYSVYYASEFLPSYYIHSIIYYQGTWEVLDATMSANASHGCIRLWTDNAEWVYNNIPGGTKVVVY